MKRMKKFFFPKKVFSFTEKDLDMIDERIYIYAENGKHSHALSLLYQTKQKNLKPYFKTYQIIIEKLCDHKFLKGTKKEEQEELIKSVLQLMKEDKYKLDLSIYKSLMEFYINFKDIERAFRIYQTIRDEKMTPNDTIVITLINYYKHGYDFQGLKKFYEHLKQDYPKLSRTKHVAKNLITSSIKQEKFSLEDFEYAQKVCQEVGMAYPQSVEDFISSHYK